MKNFTKTITNKTLFKPTRWLIMALMLLLGTSSVWGWGFKYDDGGNWNTCSSSNFDKTTFYTDPTGSSTTSVYIKMHTGLVKSGFNITQNDDCGGQKLYVNLSGTASTSSNTIVRASARWVDNQGIYSEYTIVIPDGKIYIKPTNGDAVLMTKSTYTYTAELTLSDAKTFDLYADDPGNSKIENQDYMPSAGKPTSVRLNYTNLVSDYQYVRVAYNLITNQITFEEMTPPCTPPDAPEFGSESSAEYCYGDVVSFPTINGVTLKWYDEETGGNIVESPETNVGSTNYYAAAVGECESTDRTAYTITINSIPSFTVDPINLSLCKGSTSVTDLTELSHVGVANGDPVWYDAETADNVVTTGADLVKGGTYWVAAENAETGCINQERKSFTITIHDLPKYPDLTKTSAVVCQANATVSLNELAKISDVIWYQGEDEVLNPDAISIANDGTFTYTAKAVNGNGCQSATGVDFTLTVNPLPTITSISASNDEPVPFEDVVLTADGVTPGAEVKWYLGNDDTPVATGTTYIVTSENAGEVIVKAKAFLNGCESAVATKTVTFGAEDCSNCDVTIESTKIEIWCRETGSSQAGSNLTCYAWYKDGSNHELNSDNTNKGTKTSVTKTSNIEGQEYTYRVWEFDMQSYGDYDVYVIFKKSTTAWDWQTSDLKAGKRNNRYFFTYDGSQNEQSNRGEIYSESQSLSVTTHSITAPAVKTVSATSEEGSGVVNFTGKIIKTGCAATSSIHYGYQFKKEGEDWPTTGVEASNTPVKGKLIPLTNASETALYYQFSANVENLENGIYYFRAYIINGYEFTNGNYDQGVYYGIDIPVTVSTKKYPIENLQVKYADGNGEVLLDQNVTYCVGDGAYIKLIYDGSRLKPEEDEINISSTLENTFTLVEGEADLYTFVVKGNETIIVNAKNKENTDNPTAELTINTYAVPVIPSIDIDKTTICSNDATGAKITVSNPQVGITYQVYKILGENPATTHGAAKKYSEEELEFNSMTEAGTYYVRAFNEQCPNAIAQSLDEILTVIDADATSISISPETKTVNPWVPVTFTVSKEGNYDYTFSCKEIEGENDVTSNMVINKSGDTYVVKFPKPDGVSAATDLNGQVTFADKTYKVEVKLNADVQCGTVSDESVVTLKPVNEICN